MTETNVNLREDVIRQVRAIGESLIKNAESIVGTEKHLTGIYIQAELKPDAIPSIDISRTFLPEKYIKEVSHHE